MQSPVAKPRDAGVNADTDCYRQFDLLGPIDTFYDSWCGHAKKGTAECSLVKSSFVALSLLYLCLIGQRVRNRLVDSGKRNEQLPAQSVSI